MVGGGSILHKRGSIINPHLLQIPRSPPPETPPDSTKEATSPTMNSHSRPQVPRQCMHACMPPGSRPKARKIRRGGYFKKKADRITHLSIELGACAVLALRREATYWSPSNLLGPIVAERSDGPSQEIRYDMLRLVSRYRTGTADGLLGRRALQGSPSIKERSEGVSKGLSHARLGRTRIALLCLWDMIDRGDQCLAAIGEKSGCLANHLRAELQLG